MRALLVVTIFAGANALLPQHTGRRAALRDLAALVTSCPTLAHAAEKSSATKPAVASATASSVPTDWGLANGRDTYTTDSLKLLRHMEYVVKQSEGAPYFVETNKKPPSAFILRPEFPDLKQPMQMAISPAALCCSLQTARLVLHAG